MTTPSDLVTWRGTAAYGLAKPVYCATSGEIRSNSTTRRRVAGQVDLCDHRRQRRFDPLPRCDRDPQIRRQGPQALPPQRGEPYTSTEFVASFCMTLQGCSGSDIARPGEDPERRGTIYGGTVGVDNFWVNSIFDDRKGSLWIGSRTAG